MSIISATGIPEIGPIVYPESDGKPLAESTKQLDWITLLYDNLRALYADRPDVFVGGDNFWYPVKGDPSQVLAPDVYVVFGRPKGDRGSYKQWLENDIPLTVTFEVRSPGNTDEEMIAKCDFYDHHGVQEYYHYDPETNKLEIRTRGRATLRMHHDIANFVSPQLGIRFEMTKPEMTVYGPDGNRFIDFTESQAETRGARKLADEAKRQADEAKRQKDQAVALVARLAELSRKARRGQADAEELAELERLEDQST